MTSDPKKIMIVEDQPEVADLFEEMLSLDGYQVGKIHSSTGALSVIRAEKPDIVLLDIMMPDVSGLEVLHFMQREPDLQNIPVVIVSAKSLSTEEWTRLRRHTQSIWQKGTFGGQELVLHMVELLGDKMELDRTQEKQVQHAPG